MSLGRLCEKQFKSKTYGTELENFMLIIGLTLLKS